MKDATIAATIMIVEDEAAVRELLTLSLEAQDFDTVAAGNLTDAIACLESKPVDLLLLDLRLGNENGIDLLKAIRRMPKYEKLPVILLTGCADREIVLQVAQLGVQGYLLKHQVSRKDLTARINQLLKDRESRAEESAVDRARYFGPLRVVKPILTRAQMLEQIGRRPEATSLSVAVAKLLNVPTDSNCGLEQIAVVAGNFRVRDLGRHFNSELFWEHSIATGLIAAEIMRLRNDSTYAINYAFTMGLLHDVGRMAFVEQLDDIYKRVLDIGARLQLPLEQVEWCMLMANHADVADRVLNFSEFPRRLTDAIAAHHLPDESILQLQPQKKIDVATLSLADRLAHALLLGFSGNNCQYPTEAFAQALGLNGDAIRRIENEIPKRTAQFKQAAFHADESPQAADHRERSLRKFRRSFRALYFSANPAIDGYRILLERLGGPVGDHAPNVAVVYLTNADQIEHLFGKLREAENAAKIKPLPLILVSPLANQPIDPKLLVDREFRKMPSPFALSQLADMVGSLLPSEDE